MKSEHCRCLIKEEKCQLRPAEINEYSISCANKIVYAPGERKKVTKQYKTWSTKQKYFDVDKNYQYAIAAWEEHDQKNT
jgi:hypothetical protein